MTSCCRLEVCCTCTSALCMPTQAWLQLLQAHTKAALCACSCARCTTERSCAAMCTVALPGGLLHLKILLHMYTALVTPMRPNELACAESALVCVQLCKVYDSAELCRNVHSSPAWRSAATKVVMGLGGMPFVQVIECLSQPKCQQFDLPESLMACSQQQEAYNPCASRL